jgi:hypothetical protein
MALLEGSQQLAIDLGIDLSAPSLRQYRTVTSHFGSLALEILGGPQSRLPDPVSSSTLGADPMPDGERLQSFDGFERVFERQCYLPTVPSALKSRFVRLPRIFAVWQSLFRSAVGYGFASG